MYNDLYLTDFIKTPDFLVLNHSYQCKFVFKYDHSELLSSNIIANQDDHASSLSFAKIKSFHFLTEIFLKPVQYM